jgi:hypothetical protein
MTVGREGPVAAHLRVRVAPEQHAVLRALAKQRHSSISQLLRSAIASELEAHLPSGSLPDESAIREMAILVAVELVLKLQEATIPGGITRSRQLLECAARSAMARIEMVEASLTRQAKR